MWIDFISEVYRKSISVVLEHRKYYWILMYLKENLKKGILSKLIFSGLGPIQLRVYKSWAILCYYNSEEPILRQSWTREDCWTLKVANNPSHSSSALSLLLVQPFYNTMLDSCAAQSNISTDPIQCFFYNLIIIL